MKNDGDASLLKEIAELKALLQKQLKIEKEVLLDNAEMKRRFHMSESTLYRRRKNNEIPFYKIGGKFYYPLRFFIDKANAK